MRILIKSVFIIFLFLLEDMYGSSKVTDLQTKATKERFNLTK